jgi:hypothetical protein
VTSRRREERKANPGTLPSHRYYSGQRGLVFVPALEFQMPALRQAFDASQVKK